jgi:RNA polymerase sigma-70 factor (ECF subfamily)
MSLEEFYKANRQNLINKIRGKLGNSIDAEDVVQETFSRALKHWDHYDPSKPLEGWIVGIMYNALSDFRREERMHGMPAFEEPLYDVEEAHAVKDIAYKALALTDGTEKQILTLCFSRGYSLKDIADILTLSPYIVRHTVSRFTKKLKNKWHTISTEAV